jgi:peptidyl-tRNA hydrolase
MGGTESKATTNVVTEAVNKAVVRNIIDCKSNTTVKQQITVRGDGNIVRGVRQVQGVKLSLSCAQDAQSMARMQTDVQNAIKQAAESQGVALLGALGSTDSEVNNNIRQAVSNEVTQEAIQNIVLQTNLDQGIDIDGNMNLIQDVDQSQLSDMVSRNAQKIINKMEAITSIANKVTQDTKTEQSDPITSVVSAIGNAMTSIASSSMWSIAITLIVIAAVFLGMLYAAMSMGLLDGIVEKPPQVSTSP